MVKDRIIILNWSEIDDVGPPEYHDENGQPFILPINCSDADIMIYLRNHHQHELDDEVWGVNWEGKPNEWQWRCSSIARAENSAIVEWRNIRNHLGVTTVIWC